MRSSFLRDSATLFIGTALAQGIAVAGLPVLARLYSPSEFGLLALFSGAVSLVATASTLRYETAVVPEGDEGQARNLVRVSIAAALAMVMALSVLSMAIPTSWWEVRGLGGLAPWVQLALLSGATMAGVSALGAWCNRGKSYYWMSRARVLQSSAAVIGAIAFAQVGMSGGLLWAQALGAVAGLIVLSLPNGWLYQKWHAPDLGTAARAHLDTPRYLLPNALLDVVTQQAPIYLIAAWFSEAEAGQFSMAWRVLMIPSAIAGAAVGQVFYQRFASVWPNRVESRRVLYATWAGLAALGMFPMATLALWGEALFGFVLGDEWAVAGKYAQLLAPMAFVMFVSSPTSSTYLVLGYQRLALIWGLAMFIYRPACIWIGMIAGDLAVGVFLFAAAEIISILLYQGVIVRRM